MAIFHVCEIFLYVKPSLNEAFKTYPTFKVLSVFLTTLLMSEKSQAVYYISSCHMLVDKALSSNKANSHWIEADWLHCKRDVLSSNRKVDGSRLTSSTQACHS